MQFGTSSSSSSVLEGVCLTSTGLSSRVRKEMETLALELGATWSDELIGGETTHLIVGGKTKSAKFEAATRLGLRLVQESWIRDCHGDGVRHKEIGLPVLWGCVVACTGFSGDQRDAIERVVTEDLGGEFSTTLDQQTTTHLVCDYPKGEKYEHAVRWGIPVVTSDWLQSPTEPLQAFSPSVPVENDDRIAEDMIDTRLDEVRQIVADAPEVLDVFEPCRFFIHDPPRNVQDDASNPSWTLCLALVNRGRGFVYPKYFKNVVSHVVVPPRSEPLPKAKTSLDYDLHNTPTLTFVTVEWLAHSLKAGVRLPASDFPPRWL